MSGDYGIWVHDLESSVGDGQWLVAYDPDGGPAHIDYPTGSFETDSDPAKALRFPDMVTAWKLWRTTSTRTPLRPDGRPNRPLTAFTIRVEKLP